MTQDVILLWLRFFKVKGYKAKSERENIQNVAETRNQVWRIFCPWNHTIHTLSSRASVSKSLTKDWLYRNSVQHISKFQNPQRRVGLQHEPHCLYNLFGYHETFLSLKEVSHHCWELFISQVPRCKLESTLQAGFSVTRQSQAYYTCSCTEGLQRIYKIKDIAFYSMYGIPCERCIHILISKLIYFIYTYFIYTPYLVMETLNHCTQSGLSVDSC